jgi:hypothetical protein
MGDVKELLVGVGIAVAIGVAIGLSLVAIFSIATNQIHSLSTPIEDLNHGQLYEVRGIARTNEYCFLMLRSTGDNQIRFYKLPAKDVPEDLAVGDGLIKTPIGLQRLPQQFIQK